MLAKLCKIKAQEQSSQALPSVLLCTEESLWTMRNLGRADSERIAEAEVSFGHISS